MRWACVAEGEAAARRDITGRGEAGGQDGAPGGQQEASEIYLDAPEGRGGFRFVVYAREREFESGTTWYLCTGDGAGDGSRGGYTYS